MEKDFLTIAITLPHFYKEEAGLINRMISEGLVDYVHIRKPYTRASDIESLIKKIDQEFYSRLKLHDHFELLENYELGGIHLNMRNKDPHPLAKSISKSFHSLEELNFSDGLDYFFISPVFDSISKEGYKKAFNYVDLANVIKGKKGIALGGVTPDKFPFLKELGFTGAAMSGYFFQNYARLHQ